MIDIKNRQPLQPYENTKTVKDHLDTNNSSFNVSKEQVQFGISGMDS
jgi:hypothetical protein